MQYNLDEFKQYLTVREFQVFEFIVRHMAQSGGTSPTINEIINNTDTTSSSVARYYLERLEAKGLILSREKRLARGIQLLGGSWVYSADDVLYYLRQKARGGV